MESQRSDFEFAVFERDGEVEHLFICRHDTPLNRRPASPNAWYVSYQSIVGRASAVDAGQRKTVLLPGETRIDPPVSADIFVDEKDSFTPAQTNGVWDAINNQIQLRDGSRFFIYSLRQVLDGIVERRSRPVANRMELRDQSILSGCIDDI